MIPKAMRHFDDLFHLQIGYARFVTPYSSTAKSTGVYKTIYAKNYGIIACETNPGGIAWVKQY
jgi:hypothetical protein